MVNNVTWLNKMCTINSLLIRTDVTCIQTFNSYILTGIGGQLHIFDKSDGRLKSIIETFDGQKIYGIEPDSTSTCWLIYGGKRMKILKFTSDNFFKFMEVAECNCNDWIWEAKWIDSDRNIASILMHNIVAVWTKEIKLIRKVVCEEKCILYCAHLVNNTWDNLLVLSGTVFSQILIWWPSKCKEKALCPVLHKLDGHRGVIFSVHYNRQAGLICSTSDDRSAILWSVSSKDLLRELAQPNIKILKLFCLYGHSARVFRCKVLKDRVITAGEDSLVNIWDLQGNLIRKIEAHQGSCVWSLAYDAANDVIVTGSGDCGLTIFPLKQCTTKRDLQMNSGAVPKRVVLLRTNDIVTITENGKLQYFHLLENQWTEIAEHSDLVGYALLEVSPCRNFISLAGYHGTIYIYKQVNNDLQLCHKHEDEDSSRIFALHWLSSESYLTCGPNGTLSLWNIKEGCIYLTNKFILPPSKERWTTAARILFDKYIVVGDRKGNIYLYRLDSINPIQTMKKAHNHLGITSLHVYNNEVTSLGRNSELKQYKFYETREQLTLLSSDKLPFSWLAALCENSTTLLAFFGDEFVVWDYKERRTLLQYPCGGGHRSWDFYKDDQDANFVYIKDKQVHLIQFQWNPLCPKDIIRGYHVNEINAACSLQFYKNNDHCLFISGGEDTTLRISRIVFASDFVRFEKVNVLKSHLSSIRTVAACKISKSINNRCCTETYLFFSAGGRAQIVLWELQFCSKGADATNIMCSEKYSYYEALSSDDAETRIMSLLAELVNRYVILIAARSDGLLKIFFINTFDKQNYKMSIVGSINYKLKCILKVSLIEMCSRKILLTMATDGKITFWNVTEFMQSVACIQDESKSYAALKSTLPSNPIYCLHCHQSGINSFTYRILTDSTCIFLSGGDDNAVVADLMEFYVRNDVTHIKPLARFCDTSSHCAQITGVFFFENYFLTTSVDQKLNVFKCDAVDGGIQCRFIKKHNCAVADIQGMQCFKKDDYIIAVLYGIGIEVCKVQIRNSTT